MKIVLKLIAVVVVCFVILPAIIGVGIGFCESMGYIDGQDFLSLAVIAGWVCKLLGIVLGISTIVNGIKAKVSGDA